MQHCFKAAESYSASAQSKRKLYSAWVAGLRYRKQHVQALCLCNNVSRLHHYLETVVSAAGVQIQHMRELVYADDTCLMASLPEHLQALTDGLSVLFCTWRSASQRQRS